MKKVAKVAIILNSAWQGYNFRLNLARELKNINYDVSFLTVEDGDYSERLKKWILPQVDSLITITSVASSYAS